ncbi:hypothetical protein VOI54_04875 [Tamlana sp. 2201CG12-4]|uniref:hypothetical protein n=1 Tax=Tamlana sp. 2201CG12-4 TaxID=3112582 RepID=UPI002DBFD55E|nr:hypothetical protein [Tamlana sp. 2201CG12-4]MEC3906339.1 hypothetical protein [Tamlana sp. 2201CG12-4]
MDNTIIPLEIGEVYYQDWSEGDKDINSGIKIVIPVISNINNIMLNAVYFRGQHAILIPDNDSYVGKFEPLLNKKQDFIMSNEPYAEFGNKVPKLPKEAPFELNDNECAVSYKIGETIKYFKVSNIIKKGL